MAVTLNGLLGTGTSANVTSTLCTPASDPKNFAFDKSGVCSTGADDTLPDGLVMLTFTSPLPAPAVTIEKGTSFPTGAPIVKINFEDKQIYHINVTF